MIGLFSFLAYQRNNVWQSEETLWADAVEKSVESPTAHYNLGVVFKKKGLEDRAIEEYLKVVSIKNDYEDAHSALGGIYARKKQFKKALEEFEIELSF